LKVGQGHSAGGDGRTPWVMLTAVPGETTEPAAGDWPSTLSSWLQSTRGVSFPRRRPAGCSSPAAPTSGSPNRLGTVAVTTGVHWMDTVFEVAWMPLGGSELGNSATYATYACVVAAGWLTAAEQDVPLPQTATTAFAVASTIEMSNSPNCETFS